MLIFMIDRQDYFPTEDAVNKQLLQLVIGGMPECIDEIESLLDEHLAIQTNEDMDECISASLVMEA